MTGLLIAGRMIDPRGRAAPGWIAIEGGRVAATGRGRPPGTPDVEHDGLLAPGLVDLQVNGAAGRDALDGGDALDAIDDVLARRGVTSWLAALPTAEDDRIEALVAAVADRVAEPGHGLAGLHLEGPFLSPEHAGSHRRELLRAPSSGVPGHYADPSVRLVTIAPELDGALTLIRTLRRRGVAVALGHSGADAETARRGLDAGATLVTHLFNAMGPLAHRAPGIAGVALTDPRARPCVIADGVHVDPIVLRLCRAAAGRRVVLVSDASAPAAAGPGTYRLGGSLVAADASGTVRTEAGTLAGSGVLLDGMVRRWARLAGASVPAALAAASWRPAHAIGLAPLDPGAPADVVLLSEVGETVRILRLGRWLEPSRAGEG
jgi:N-acetylglucosamine-6-phosphate deacetylase